MILITIGGVLALISLLGLWLCTVSDSNNKGLSGVCGFSLMVGMALIPAGVIEILPKKTTALDVYQDKATLFCNADTDDFPANEPFPFLTYVEVINNTVEEQTLYRKIDWMWSHYTYKQIQEAKENNICL